MRLAVSVIWLAVVLAAGWAAEVHELGGAEVEIGALDAAPLSCHKQATAEGRAACCQSAMTTWLQKTPLFKQKKAAKQALLLASVETPELKAAAKKSAAVLEASVTMRTYKNAIKECAVSETGYVIPANQAASAARESAGALYSQAEAKSKAAKASAKNAAKMQVQTAKDYQDVSEKFAADQANAGAAQASKEKAAMVAGYAKEKVKAAANALQLAREDATAATDQIAAAKEALATLSKKLEVAKAAQSEKLSEFAKELTDLKKKVTAARAAKEEADSHLGNTKAKYDIAAAGDKKSLLVEVDSAQASADTRADAVKSAVAAVSAKETEKAQWLVTSNGDLASQAALVETAKTKVQTAKAQAQEAENKVSVNEDASIQAEEAARTDADSAAKAAAAAQVSADILSKAKADRATLKEKADTWAAKAKEATQMQTQVDSQLETAKENFDTSVKSEEKAVAAKMDENAAAAAAKWDTEFDILNKKLGAVDERVDNFSKCVKNNRWICAMPKPGA